MNDARDANARVIEPRSRRNLGLRGSALVLLLLTALSVPQQLEQTWRAYQAARTEAERTKLAARFEALTLKLPPLEGSNGSIARYR